MTNRGGAGLGWAQLTVGCGLAMLVAAQQGRAAAVLCVGDCDANGEVTVDELVRGVNIALGALPLSQCLAFETNSDGEVTIDELLQGVNAALAGCPAPTPTVTPTANPVTQTLTPTASCTPGSHPAPGCAYEGPTFTATATPTPTATPIGSTATATSTPVPFGRAVAGRAAVIASGLNSFAPLVTAVITGLQNGEPVACSGGGQVMRTCSGDGTVTIVLDFAECTLDAPDGTVTFDSGTITLVGQGACPNVVIASPDVVVDESVELQATYRDRNGAPILLVSASLNSTITKMQIMLGVTCFVTGGTVALNGSISVQVPSGAGSRVNFNDTAMVFDIREFNSDCLPLHYALTLNGSGTVTETASGQSFAATLTNFVADQVGMSPLRVQLSGAVTSPCLGGTVSLQTLEPLSQEPASLCYGAGLINVMSNGSSQLVRYVTGDRVELDTNADGLADEVYPSCLPLLACAS